MRRLLRVADGPEVARSWSRLLTVLGDPDRYRLVEPLREVGAEPIHRREPDVGIADLLRRPKRVRRRIGMRRPRVERQLRVGLGDEPRERGGRDRVAARRRGRVVVPAVRGLAGRDERVLVARLDPLVGGHEELRVDARADDLRAAELRRQEELQVRLVPDREPSHDAAAGLRAVVARREHLRELREVVHVLRRVVRRLAAVGPRWGERDRQQHLQPVLGRGLHHRVDVGEVVGRVVAVEGVRGPRRRHRRPVDEDVDDRSVRRLSGGEILCGVRRPAEARVVEEAHRHPGNRVRSGRWNRKDDDDYEKRKPKLPRHGAGPPTSNEHWESTVTDPRQGHVKSGSAPGRCFTLTLLTVAETSVEPVTQNRSGGVQSSRCA